MAGPVDRTSDAGILVVGATGFVGRALTERLVREGHRVRGLVRAPGRAPPNPPAGTEWAVGDLLEPATLSPALRGIQTVYYLAHAMGSSDRTGAFAVRDRTAATNLLRAADEAGVERIVYVGGLGDEASGRSPHLESRREVARILASGRPRLTTFRAAIVVGAGGASFEMLVQLVERLPAMLCPRWIRTRCQPIALSDLVTYLVRSLALPETIGRTFDVGGPDVLPYYELLNRVGDRLGRRSRLVILPWLTPGLSAHWVGFITDVPANVARFLVEGMATEVVCRENEVRRWIPLKLLSFEEALDRALTHRPLRPLGLRQAVARAVGAKPHLVATVDLTRLR